MGFYYNGLVAVLLVLIPNGLYFFFKPHNVPENLAPSPPVLTVLERAGQLGCFVLPVILGRQINMQSFNIWPILMGLCLLAYYFCWARYLVNGKEYSLLFVPLWLIPIPMAVFPVLYFFFIGVWIASPYMLTAATLLAVGHLSISWKTYAQIR